MKLVFVSLSAVAGVVGLAWMVTPHHPAHVRHECAVTLHADGSWSTADLSDSDALHYPCEVKP